ncbi:MAG: hypothetical protein RL189_1833 [Pseudomonadota bacterium]|jgi:type III restriction enzyme
MNERTTHVAQRLSLRKPQKESLELLARIVKTIGVDPKEDAQRKFEKASSLKIQDFSAFERDFPSFAFALATGVGKTRLMGAFIAYLFLEHKINDYLILAPNLTIYNKLIEDFSNSSNPKYVFRGIGEFVHLCPKIITGDNYANVSTQRKVSQAKTYSSLFEDEVSINIFNISKINAETRSGNAPKIKRLSEYLGESYFEYLRNIDQLVLLMDEAHQYRAERGMTVINELKPLMGIELTATPKTRQGAKSIPFQNVVYQYSLAQAIKDGFVKDPAVATRRNFDQAKLKQLDDAELDRLKLEDAVRVHENTKTHLISYARNNHRDIVKPFILVVAKDTTHAKEIEDYIKSPSFFESRYTNNVITVHSNLKGEEKDENIELLLSLERPENPVEIVIHVNMLKEGWDVTNLYTLVPLRAFAADILTEQTLGRGLRLPYGEKTGDENVDKLTVIAHDRFDDLIKASQEENSIILKQTIVDVEDSEYSANQEVVTIATEVEKRIEESEQAAEKQEDVEQRNAAILEAKVKRAILAQLRSDNADALNIDPTKTDSADTLVSIEEIVRANTSASSALVDESALKKLAKSIVKNFLPEVISGAIAIPRIVIQPKENSIRAGFRPFKLVTKGLPRFNPIHDEIIVKTLQEQKDSVIGVIDSRSLKDSNENLIVAKLLDHDEVDYERDCELLFSLAKEMIEYLKTLHTKEGDVTNVVLTQRDQLATQIFDQMKPHFFCEASEYETPQVKPFTAIEPHNFSTLKNAEPKDIKTTVKSISELKKTLFTGFKKACHRAYKFDSFGEQRFAQLLESDGEKDIMKWLRPAPRQFRIYWDHQTKNYEPDFVVETSNHIWMVEIKAKTELAAADTLEKRRAAMEYCCHASEYNDVNGGKRWGYVLIPDEEIGLNKTFDYLCKAYEQIAR